MKNGANTYAKLRNANRSRSLACISSVIAYDSCLFDYVTVGSVLGFDMFYTVKSQGRLDPRSTIKVRSMVHLYYQRFGNRVNSC